MSRGMEVPVSEMRFVDWRGRPAVVCGSRAWAALPPGGSWTEVEASEVLGAGRASSAEELGDRYFEILRGAGGVGAPPRGLAGQNPPNWSPPGGVGGDQAAEGGSGGGGGAGGRRGSMVR